MFNESLSTNSTSLRIITNSLSMLLILIFIVGILLNLVSIIFILKVKKLRAINLLILNLALADLVYISGIPFYVVHEFSQSWPFQIIGCQLFFLTDFIGMFTGVYTVVALSVERFFEVVDKKKRLETFSCEFKRGLISFYLLLLWSLSVVFSLPMVLSIQINSSSCDTNWNDFELNVYFTIKYLFSFIIPFMIISYSSLRLLLYLKECNRNSQRRLHRTLNRKVCEPNEQSDEKTFSNQINTSQSVRVRHKTKSYSIRHKAIRIVLSIVILFFIQWTPLWLTELLKALPTGFIGFDLNINFFNLVATIISYSNALMNPLLYIFLTYPFKKFIKEYFTLKC